MDAVADLGRDHRPAGVPGERQAGGSSEGRRIGRPRQPHAAGREGDVDDHVPQHVGPDHAHDRRRQVPAAPVEVGDGDGPGRQIKARQAHPTRCGGGLDALGRDALGLGLGVVDLGDGLTGVEHVVAGDARNLGRNDQDAALEPAGGLARGGERGRGGGRGDRQDESDARHARP
ncbi:hypothetical protein LRS10_02985 [Phenylobacterium sp. J426]|uniref:hypothetical protein n=1 Tax=Phenylobacterium sp. J426 TaxID=2898439 RepID=UPI002151AD7B|nr:hypothetical protein [Phenylobacterium sp. J426]MCR5873248.1 hypothetical protein [Phenylobacterium sp. J426]